jgi:tetratricopeptide (TPR) repeat protein
MDETALRQLMWIKWLLVGVVLAIVVPVAISSWYIFDAFSEISSNTGKCGPSESGQAFKDHASDLLLAGKEQEVLKLASARESKYPKDPDVHYYRGRAYFQLGEYKKAIESLSVAESIFPGWRERYTGPDIREAKSRLANSSSQKAQGSDTAVDQNNAYDRQVKKAAEQQQRMDQLLTVQEQQAKRFGAILDRWAASLPPKAP